jgi:GNAT superfamily N-acetyltransferase
VAQLYQREVRASGSPPPAALVGCFERTLLDQPWSDPEIPSLVYEDDDGRVLGFVGAHVRRARLEGAEIRVVCAAQLLADPSVRRRGVGAVLLRDLLGGAQELSITDGATATVVAVWERLGGRTRFLQSIAWARVFRPAGAAARLLEGRRRRMASHLLRPVATALDPVVHRRTRPGAPGDVDPPEELTVPMVLEHVGEVAARTRVRVDYDTPFLEWLFREMEAVSARGELVRRAVRRRGRLVGWYVAYLPRGGIGEAMQIAAVERGVETVLDCLFTDAWQRGVTALQGRLEPPLFEPLLERRCLLRWAERALAHSRDPEIAAAVAAGDAMLTRMDGEWWMGHHLDPLPSAVG